MGAASPMVMMLLMFGVFYFILIRPQSKKQKEHQALLSGLEEGDVVVTRGGIIGKVTGSNGAELVLEIQHKIRIKVLRSHIDGKYNPAEKSDKSSSSSKKAA